MVKSNPDIFFYRSGCPGIVSIFAKILNKKIIKSIASDAKIKKFTELKKFRLKDIILYFARLIDFKFADVIICQNTYQKKKLEKMYYKKTRLISNAYSIPSYIQKKNQENILWIGTIKPNKQPEILLDIAKKLPKYNFIMIGGKSINEDYFKKIKKSAQEIENLEFIGYVPHYKIFDYYKKSILLINTSKYEGFPNIFIESWMYNIPTISLNVDPDKIIVRNKLGYHSRDIYYLISDIKKLMENKDIRLKFANNARRYVKDNHNIKKIVDLYEKEISNLL